MICWIWPRLVSGHMDLEEGEVDVGEIIAVSLRQVNGRAKVAGLTLIDAVPPGLPPLWADERKLKQVVLNLLSNAVNFTPRGGEIKV